MSRRLAAIVFLALLASAYECRAIVGESYGDIVKRYGQPEDFVIGEPPQEQHYTFHSNEMKIVVTFVNKVSQSEAYSPLSEDHKFTAKEAGVILGSNSNGIGFTKRDDGATLCDNFDSEDGKLCAIIIKSGPLAGRLIQVCSRKWMDSL
jgi:hypothetical protein